MSAQSAASIDPLLERYQQRRDAITTIDGHAALAKWCRREGLVAESRFHWLTVLEARPDDRAAINALGLARLQGRLVEQDEARSEASRRRLATRSVRQWARRVARWEKSRSADDSGRDTVLEEVRTIRDEHATPAFESLAERLADRENRRFGRRFELCRAYIDALSEDEASAATAALARFAVLTPDETLRDEATEALRGRPLLDSVPVLLAGLRATASSEFDIRVAPSGEVAYTHTVSSETRDADYEFRKSRLGVIASRAGGQRAFAPLEGWFVSNGRNVNALSQELWERRLASAQRQIDYAEQAEQIESRVASLNKSAAEINARITPVLTRVTGQRLGESPRAWWNYWEDFQGYARYEHRPVYVRYDQSEEISYVSSPPPSPPRHECFVAGTPVWTRTGRVAIERLEAGDVVLTKNVDTEELGFRAVLATTVRDPSPTIEITVGDERLVATTGHPFWVVGRGWRMAKQLAVGDLLSTVEGPVAVASIDSAPEAQAYNLIVEGTNDYFVGELGVLARDNTPRDSTLSVASR